jgi:hypothetical protein
MAREIADQQVSQLRQNAEKLQHQLAVNTYSDETKKTGERLLNQTLKTMAAFVRLRESPVMENFVPAECEVYILKDLRKQFKAKISPPVILDGGVLLGRKRSK